MSSFTNAIEAGRAFLKVVVDDADVAKGFERVQAKLNTIGQKMQKWGAITAGVSSAVVGSIAAAAKSFATAGAAIDDMSKRTGFGAKSLSALSYAAQQSGTDINAIEKAIRGMEKFMLGASRGGAGFAMTLDEIGVSLQDLQGANPERQFQLLSEAIAGVDDPTQRAALAMKVFGKSGADLLPLLTEGKDGIAALRAEAHRLGLVLTDEDVAAAAKLDDALARLSVQAEMAFNQIGAAVAGPLTDFGDKISESLAGVIDFIKAHRDLVTAIAAIGAAAIVATGLLAALGTALTIATKGVGGLSKAIGFLVANPMLAGLAAVAEAFYEIGKAATAAEKAIAAGRSFGVPGVASVDRDAIRAGIRAGANQFPSASHVATPTVTSGTPTPNLNTPRIDPMQQINANLGINGHDLGGGVSGKNKFNRRMKDWADAVAGTASALNPLGGLGLGDAAGKAARFGKRALAGDVDVAALGEDFGKQAAELMGGVGRFFSGKTSMSSLGTFSAGAVGSLQTGPADQLLDVSKQQLATLNRIERKDSNWGAT